VLIDYCRRSRLRRYSFSTLCRAHSLSFCRSILRLDLIEGLLAKTLSPVARAISSQPMSIESHVTMSFNVTPSFF